jgi:hypothetical protein
VEASEAFERFEKHNEAMEHGAGGEHDVGFAQRAAVVVSIMAAFLAIATFLGNEANKDAIQNTVKLGDANTEHATFEGYQVTAGLDEAILGTLGQSSDKALNAASISTIKQLQTQVLSQFDPGDKQFATAITVATKDVNKANNKHLWYELAEVGLQVGIVLAGVSIIARKHWLLFGGGALGLAGIVVLAVGFFAIT